MSIVPDCMHKACICIALAGTLPLYATVLFWVVALSIGSIWMLPKVVACKAHHCSGSVLSSGA